MPSGELADRLRRAGLQDVGDPFEAWLRLRGREGSRTTLIDLYGLAGLRRGLEPHELPQAERAELARRGLPAMWPGFETVGAERVEPIELSEYDPAWPERFDAWRGRIARALGPAAQRVEHVGSTAVPGLIAKPVIDVQVSVPDLADEPLYVPQLQEVGLQLRGRDELHRYLRPPPDRPRDAHVHVCPTGGEWERRHLLFRDHLRAHPEAAARYAATKRLAAERWREDRIAYTEAKTGVILDLMEQAEGWATSTGWSVGASGKGPK